MSYSCGGYVMTLCAQHYCSPVEIINLVLYDPGDNPRPHIIGFDDARSKPPLYIVSSQVIQNPITTLGMVREWHELCILSPYLLLIFQLHLHQGLVGLDAEDEVVLVVVEAVLLADDGWWLWYSCNLNMSPGDSHLILSLTGEVSQLSLSLAQLSLSLAQLSPSLFLLLQGCNKSSNTLAVCK